MTFSNICVNSKNWNNSKNQCCILIYYVMYEILCITYFFIIVDEDFHNNVQELDVHNGCHWFLFCSHQSWSKTNTKICHSHQILVAQISHPGKPQTTYTNSGSLMEIGSFGHNTCITWNNFFPLCNNSECNDVKFPHNSIYTNIVVWSGR